MYTCIHVSIEVEVVTPHIYFFMCITFDYRCISTLFRGLFQKNVSSQALCLDGHAFQPLLLRSLCFVAVGAAGARGYTFMVVLKHLSNEKR